MVDFGGRVCFRFLFKDGCLWSTEGAKGGGGGVKTQAYQLLTRLVNLPAQPDSHFLFPNTLGAAGYV